MSKAASEGVPVDSITFSGNGEPTMNPDFPEIIDVTLELRDKYFPEAKVSVLSNATLIGRPAVAQALMKVDNPILKQRQTRLCCLYACGQSSYTQPHHLELHHA